MMRRLWQAAQDDADDELPRDRIEALVELVAVTPFTIVRRVLNVVIGPRRVRQIDDWIDGRDEGCN